MTHQDCNFAIMRKVVAMGTLFSREDDHALEVVKRPPDLTMLLDLAKEARELGWRRKADCE